jgi:hypothetical protein
MVEEDNVIVNRYFYSFFRNILNFPILCGINLFPGKPAMFRLRTSELAGRKVVRLGLKGGSLGNYSKGVGDIPVSIGMYTHTPSK